MHPRPRAVITMRGEFLFEISPVKVHTFLLVKECVYHPAGVVQRVIVIGDIKTSDLVFLVFLVVVHLLCFLKVRVLRSGIFFSQGVPSKDNAASSDDGYQEDTSPEVRRVFFRVQTHHCRDKGKQQCHRSEDQNHVPVEVVHSECLIVEKGRDRLGSFP